MRRWFSVMACSLMLGGVGCSSAVDEEAAQPPGEATPPETAANDAACLAARPDWFPVG